MALVEIQCKSCGGALRVDDCAKTYVCSHCGNTYTMEQTINQVFQTTNIGTATIIDDGSGKIDQEISSGEAFLSFHEYDNARKVFYRLTQQYAHRYRAWWGLARAITEEFTNEPFGKSEYFRVKDAVDHACKLAPADERVLFQETSAAYLARWQEHCIQLADKREQVVKTIELEAKELLSPKLKEIDEIKATIQAKTEKIRRVEKIGKIVPLIAFAVIGVLLFIFSLDGNSFVGAILSGALVSGVAIFLPLKLVFFVIIKVMKNPHDVLISKLNRRISQIEGTIIEDKRQVENERNAVFADTGWLDR